MIYSREDLRGQLQRREFAPVYLLFGPESYLRGVAAKTIADLSFSPTDLRDFNDTSFTLNVDGNLKSALAAAQQLPMMAARRVVRITDVRISASGYRDTITEKDEELLAAYFENPSPQTIVIFVADELNGTRKMGKFLREKAAAVEFARLTGQQLAEWARKEFTASGVSIDNMALHHFLMQMGSDVLRMTNEIRKLAAASLPEGNVSVDLIDSLVANSRELTNFELTDDLVAGRRGKALVTLKKILDDGAEPVALVGLLSYNYRMLAMAKDQMARGIDRGEIARLLKMRYSDQERYFAAARRADLKSLTRSLELLARTDVAIKSSVGGSDSSRMMLEVLVCELALQ